MSDRADYVLVHECQPPEVTDEMRAAAERTWGHEAAGWWRCPDCQSSWYLERWYLAGSFHTSWSLHARRFPKRLKTRRHWWQRKRLATDQSTPPRAEES